MVTKIATIIIKNRQGQFFVHQRNAAKKKFPNYFALGAGGHVEDGEAPIDAAARELYEETGVRTDVEYLFTCHYKDNTFDNILYVHSTEINEEHLQPNEGEWQWSGWMPKKEIDSLWKEDKLCPDTALFYEEYCLHHLKENC